MIAPVKDMTAAGIRSGKFFPVSGIPTQLLVLHSAECPLRAGFAQSLTEWASSVYPAAPEASWHRFVDPIARVRMIPDDLGAWHASEANPLSIGWEQAGYARFTRTEWLTADGLKQMDNLAYDMAEVAVRDGIPARWLTNAQVTAATGGDRSVKGFCTHRQIDPETRTDPGDGYPYDLLMQKVRAYMGGTKPVVKDEVDMAPVAEIVKAVWSAPVRRVVGGKTVSIPAIQELADTKTQVIAQGALLKELASRQGMDPKQVEAILRDAAREALGGLAVVSRVETVDPEVKP